MTTVVEVKGLGRRFDSITAVEDVSFEVNQGELFGIVGPDGAGKTTLFRMLAGVLRPTSGDATIHNISVARSPERVKSSIAYMSQRFGLYADLTVTENLQFYADLYRVPRSDRPERLERLFRFSGLEPFRDRLAGKLSGGMKQKLGLSCALIHHPELLLLDEPTFGVDPISRRDLWIIIHEMVGEGVTVMVSTSYMDEAERFDRVALLNRGRLIALDTPDALLQQMEGELLAVTARPTARAQQLVEKMAEVRRAVAFGTRLHLSVDSAERASAPIRSALEAGGISVDEIKAIPPSLEDVFIERTEGRA